MKSRKNTVLSTLAAATIAVSGATIVPQAGAYVPEEFTPVPPPTQNFDNIKPLVDGSGLVNCTSTDTCIDEETGMAQVEFKVQSGVAGVSSSEQGGFIDRGTEIAIPKVLDNVKVRIDTFYPSEETAKRLGVNQEVMKINSELPLYVSNVSELSENSQYNVFKREDYMDSEAKFDILGNDKLDDFDYFTKNAPVTFSTLEDSLRDTALTPSLMPQGASDEYPQDRSEFTYKLSNGEVDTYTTPNADLYNYISIPANDFSGIYSYTIVGDVKVESDLDEMYLPYRAEQKSWRCFASGVGVGGFDEGCNELKNQSWARNGSLPYYNLTDARANRELAARTTIDGLEGSKNCAVTSEGSADKIGTDKNPRNFYEWLGISSKEHYDQFIEAGFELDRPYQEGLTYYRVTNGQGAEGSSAKMMIDTLGIGSVKDVDYVVSGYGVQEDGCDQAAVKLTWCPKEEETPAVLATKTIVTTTRETETITAPPVTKVETATETSTFVAGSSDASKCVARNVGLTLGVLAAVGTSAALVSQVNLPGLAEANSGLQTNLGSRSDFAAQISQRIAEENDRIQRGLGVHNDQIRRAQQSLAQEAARIQRELGIYNEGVTNAIASSNLPTIAGGLAGVAVLAGVGIHSANECAKDENYQIFGGLNEGSSNGSSVKGATVKTQVAEPTPRKQ